MLLCAAHVLHGTWMQQEAGLLQAVLFRAVNRAAGLCMAPLWLLEASRQSGNLWVGDAQSYMRCVLASLHDRPKQTVAVHWSQP